MNIIFFSRREGRAKHFNLAHPLAVVAFSTVLVAILAAAFRTSLANSGNFRETGGRLLSRILSKELPYLPSS